VDAVAALAITYLFLTGILIPVIMGTALPAIAWLYEQGIAWLLIIPWYGYVLGGIPAVYIGYLFVWCVARELTEDDWESQCANGPAIFAADAADAAADAASKEAMKTKIDEWIINRLEQKEQIGTRS